jgi:twitching motility protein PilT
MIRVHGDVRRINIDPLDHKTVHAMVYDIMSDAQRKQYEEFLEVDFSFEIEGLARFVSTPSTRTAARRPCSVPFPARS